MELRARATTKPWVTGDEARIAATFDHPCIVKTFTYGVTTNDEQFIVMEFLDGPGLNSLIIGRPVRAVLRQ